MISSMPEASPLEAVPGGDGLRQMRVGLDEGVQTDVDALEGGQHLGVAEAEGVALAGESGSDDGDAKVAGHGGGSFRVCVNRCAESLDGRVWSSSLMSVVNRVVGQHPYSRSMEQEWDRCQAYDPGDPIQ